MLIKIIKLLAEDTILFSGSLLIGLSFGYLLSLCKFSFSNAKSVFLEYMVQIEILMLVLILNAIKINASPVSYVPLCMLLLALIVAINITSFLLGAFENDLPLDLKFNLIQYKKKNPIFVFNNVLLPEIKEKFNVQFGKLLFKLFNYVLVSGVILDIGISSYLLANLKQAFLLVLLVIMASTVYLINTINAKAKAVKIKSR